MTYIIVTRNPNSKCIQVVTRLCGDDAEDPPIAEYKTFDEAMGVANNIPSCVAWDFDIVEIFV